MRNKVIGFTLGVLLLALSFPVAAQQAGKIPRIGFLQRRVAPTPTNPDPLGEAFKQGLRDLGYIEGKNILVEHRYGEGSEDRLPGLVTELVQLKVDVLVIPTSHGIRAAKQTTTTIPIVMVTPADPVAAGFIQSLARPGGNITGHYQAHSRPKRKTAGTPKGSGSGDIAGRSPYGRYDHRY